MAEKSRRSRFAEENRRRRHLKKWQAAVLSPAKRLWRGEFSYICQVSEASFLFLKEERAGRKDTFFLFDVANASFKPFSVPALNSLLVDFSLEEQSLRFDEDTGVYFYCSRRSQKDGGPGFYLVPGEPDEGTARWISTEREVISLFVSAKHLYLLNVENAELIRISKASLLAMADAAGASKPIALVPPGSRTAARELGLRRIPLGNRLEDDGVLVTAFSRDRLIVGHGERYMGRFPVFTRLHALDFASNRFKEFWIPSFACADFGEILNWIEKDPAAFDRYLSFLSLCDGDLHRLGGEFLFFSAGGVLYMNGDFRPYDPGAVTEEAVAACGDLVDFRFRSLMSKDRGELDQGILKAIRAPTGLAYEDEIRFILEKIGKGRIDTVDWPELAGDRVDHLFLTYLAKVLGTSDERVPRAVRWLERKRARQYVALVLLAGKAGRPGPAAVLDGEERGIGRSWLSQPAALVFASESEIPVSAVRELAERWAREARTLLEIAEEDRTEDQRADLEDFRHLLEAAAAAALAWETEAGYALVRWLDAQEIGVIKPKIISLIGERNAHAVQDLLGAYLRGEDAGLAKEAIMALWHSEILAPEEELLRWLKSAEDHAPDRAAYALGLRGPAADLPVLFYSEIIGIAESRLDEDEPFRLQESDGIERLISRVLKSRLGDPPQEGSLEPAEIAGMEACAPYYLLDLIKRAFHRDEGLARSSGTGSKREDTTAMLGFLSRTFGLGGERFPFDYPFLNRLASRSGKTSKMVERVLDFFLGSDLPEDVRYILALQIVFTPGLVGLSRAHGPSGPCGRIMILLKSVFDRMVRENDLRRMFAVFALVELGIGRENERTALDFFRGEEWREWPRLLKLGEYALRYLPGAERALIYEKILHAVRSGEAVSRYAKKLAEASPRRAVELYERGLFKLGRLDEALLYGQAGDGRGRDGVLAHFVRRGGSDEVVSYLGEYGGEEAIVALQRARDEFEAKARPVNLAIRKIRARLRADPKRGVRKPACGRRRGR